MLIPVAVPAAVVLMVIVVFTVARTAAQKRRVLIYKSLKAVGYYY